MNYKLEEEKIKNADYTAFKQNFDGLRGNINKENITQTIPYLYNMIDILGGWDEIVDFMNYGNKDVPKEKRDGILSTMERFLKYGKSVIYEGENAKKILLTKEQIKEQFQLTSDKGQIEMLANTMEIANTLLRILNNNREIINAKIESNGIEMSQLINLLVFIREESKNSLIEGKNKKELLLIGKIFSNSSKEILLFAIPGYFEPFTTLINDTRATKKVNGGYDDLYFIKQDGGLLNSSFPFKVNKEQREMLNYLYQNEENKELKSVSGRINWFEVTQSNFKIIENKRKIFSPKIDEKDDNKKLISEKPITKQVQENLDFWKKINEKIGSVFTEEFIQGLVNRASYSFENLYKRLETEIIENLKGLGIEQDNIDTEVSKVFLYIRITRQISAIGKGNIKNDEIKDIIKEAVKEYKEGFRLIIEKIQEEKDYKQIRKELKQYALSKKYEPVEKDILDGEETIEETIDIEEKQSESIQPEKEEETLTKEPKILGIIKRFNELNRERNKIKEELKKISERATAKESELQEIRIRRKGEEESLKKAEEDLEAAERIYKEAKGKVDQIRKNIKDINNQATQKQGERDKIDEEQISIKKREKEIEDTINTIEDLLR